MGQLEQLRDAALAEQRRGRKKTRRKATRKTTTRRKATRKTTTRRKATRKTTTRRKTTTQKNERSRRPGETFKTHMARLRKLDGR